MARLIVIFVFQIFLFGFTSSDCIIPCTECKEISSGPYQGFWYLIERNSSSCAKPNMCLYQDIGNTTLVCMCDPGNHGYTPCGAFCGGNCSSSADCSPEPGCQCIDGICSWPPASETNSTSKETVLTIIENGQEVKQKTTVDLSSGVMTIEVPPHVTSLNESFAKSTTMYNPVTNISMTKSNSSCILSDIPGGINEYFQRTAASDGEMTKIVYDVKMVDYILGPKKRETLIPEMDNLCNNEIITKTETLNIDKSQYEKLINDEVIFIKKEQSKRTKRSCSLRASPACTGSNDNIRSCVYWQNPIDPDNPDKDILLHSISNKNLCLTCCYDTEGCNCTDYFKDSGQEVCPCSSIIDKKTFYDCLFKNGTFKTIIQNNGASQKRSADSDSSVVYQTTTYNSEVEERSVKIHVPAHGDNEETTVLMHALTDGEWHTIMAYYNYYGYYDYDYDQLIIKNNMMLKLGSICHVRTLPYSIKPIEIAYDIKSITKGLDLENSILTPSNEKKKHFIILNDNSLTSQEEADLNKEITEMCTNAKLVRYTEVEISEDEFQKLNNGGILDLKNEMQTDKCIIKTKVTSVASGGWRWPKTKDDSGTESMVHGLIKSVIQANCCSKNSGHHSTYCNCEDIIDRYSFERCSSMFDMIVVIAGAQGTNFYDQVASFKNDSSSGFQLTNSTEKPSFPVKTKQGIGAWINNNLYVCQGYVQGEVPDGDGCFMMKSGYGNWTKPSTTILTEPLKFGGAAAKYKSGPTGKEPGETWWIIGGDHFGTRTQEWNSMEGANPWDPPILPVPINTPCMVAISDREIFITAVPLYEAWTSKAWTYSRDNANETGNGWTTIPSLKEKRDAPACGFLPNNGSGWIVVAGGHHKSSTEILDVNKCKNNDWDCDWEYGPELGSNFYRASMVTMAREYIVLIGDQTEILAINSTFQNWEIIGETSQPRSDAVVLTIPT